jgi:hypothetical protein
VKVAVGALDGKRNKQCWRCHDGERGPHSLVPCDTDPGESLVHCDPISVDFEVDSCRTSSVAGDEPWTLAEAPDRGGFAAVLRQVYLQSMAGLSGVTVSDRGDLAGELRSAGKRAG